MIEASPGIDRRRFTAFSAGFGLAATALPRLLRAAVENGGGVSKEALIGAEKLAGLGFSDDVGRGAVQGPVHRRGCDGGQATRFVGVAGNVERFTF